MADRNVLWIMCDQLRFDYLSCYGHPHLHTPNIDALAARGVRFTQAYVQSPVCGPSRMSSYTGRYMRSHGTNWNRFPLRVGEPTLGDHLAELGVRTVLVGKTHMQADLEGMRRLGIDPTSSLGVQIAECGFEPYERDDGLNPDPAPRVPYDDYLRAQGFDATNPWEQWANSAEAPDGTLLSGWLMEHADKPARIPEEHSETPYMTRRAMRFIDDAAVDGRPWCLHLSYIKPHWPYIVPAPYHAMYGLSDIVPPIRSQNEKHDPHPVYGAFMAARVSQAFSRDEVRRRVIPAYMGLIKQIDDQIGVLMCFLADRGLLDTTMIAFTSDHGDYLGDHWLGEKDLFHDCSAKVPLIVVDPSPAADATRGTASDALVEAIDLVPSFIRHFGGEPKSHVVEGRALQPLLHGQAVPDWRHHVFSEYDYGTMPARRTLNTPVGASRLYMVFDGRWKYIHAVGFRPMLYDLGSDPDELHDRGADPAYADVCARLKDALLAWSLRDHNRITTPDARIAGYSEAAQLKAGIVIGFWDQAELDEATPSPPGSAPARR
jgi:arylsulfatase A-like enzyme